LVLSTGKSWESRPNVSPAGAWASWATHLNNMNVHGDRHTTVCAENIHIYICNGCNGFNGFHGNIWRTMKSILSMILLPRISYSLSLPGLLPALITRRRSP
jgi:hypothetical protein